MTNQMSKELGSFYIAIQEWVDSGCKTEAFSRTTGLCWNLGCFFDDVNAWADSEIELEQQFTSEGLDSEFPFNNEEHPYLPETNKYTNPKRLAWIRKYSNIAKQGLLNQENESE